MKHYFPIITMFAATFLMAQDGRAKMMAKTFSRETSVSINIKAEPAIVWTLLTTASDYPRWNSTVVSREGEIKEG